MEYTRPHRYSYNVQSIMRVYYTNAVYIMFVFVLTNMSSIRPPPFQFQFMNNIVNLSNSIREQRCRNSDVMFRIFYSFFLPPCLSARVPVMQRLIFVHSKCPYKTNIILFNTMLPIYMFIRVGICLF